MPETSAEEYWDIWSMSHREDLHLFLQLFEPTSGVFSKNRGEQWVVIKAKIIPQLSEAAMIAKEQYFCRQLNVISAELTELTEDVGANDGANDRANDVAKIPAITT
jgi:hypothetical protein